MARGNQQAATAGKSAQNFSNTLQGNTAGVFGELAPQLEAEATHPAGYDPATLAKMNTASQQSAGGSMAGAVGQGALLGARTRNAGAAQNAVAQSARTSGQNLSKAALGTQVQNANLQQHQQQAGLSGLQGLYGQSLGGANQALGIVPQAANANTNAANQSWDWAKYILDPAMQAAGGAGAAYLGS